FSESTARAIVVVGEYGDNAFHKLCSELNQPVMLIGEVADEIDGLAIGDGFQISYAELEQALRSPLLRSR
ncbi:MAG: hypothetical protein ACO3CN_02295, partial [Candidatus Nanopelagicales bacterium]